MLITLGYFLLNELTCFVLVRQYIYFYTSSKPTLCMKEFIDFLFSFSKQKVKIINEAYKVILKII